MENEFKFHITPQKGWMNDPNGLVYFKGQYHIFYQHYPNDVNWGPMHWGHVISDDLIHFKHAPIALYPDMEDGCFSGSSIVVDDVLYVFYTSFFEKDGVVRQLQSMAYSTDGFNFKKYGLIIDETKLPSIYDPADFRDPKIYKKDDEFILLVAAKRRGGTGRIIMFKSNNLKDWEFVSDVLEKDCKGIMIECPDYNDELGLLIHCEQFQPNEDKYHLNIHTNRYLLGRINNDNKFVGEEIGLIDYGFDFYAPQMFANKNILIGWLSMWDRDMHTRGYGYAGVLTIPRQIEVVNNHLYQTPIFDRTNEERFEIENYFETNISEGVLEIDLDNIESFEIEVKKGDNETTKIYSKNEYIVFDRSQNKKRINGAEKDEFSLKGERYMPFIKEEHNKIYVVIDRFSIEFFFNGLACSNLVYNDIDNDKFTLKFAGHKGVVKKYFYKNKKIS